MRRKLIMSFNQSFNTFIYLLQRSIIVYKPHFFDKTINALIWTVLNTIVVSFIMPTVGLHDFGPFSLISVAASNSFFVATNQISGFVTEIEDKSSNLTYELTLPIQQTYIFIKYALEYAYQGFITSILVLPIGLILLHKEFDFTYLYLVKFHCILAMISIFSGFFSLWMSSFISDIFHGLENIWIRIVFPLWFLGGFQFYWKGLHAVAPKLAYINLLNPLTYALEGCRACTLNPTLSLSYWLCMIMLLFFTALFGFWSIKKLKKRLDCL